MGLKRLATYGLGALALVGFVGAATPAAADGPENPNQQHFRDHFTNNHGHKSYGEPSENSRPQRAQRKRNFKPRRSAYNPGPNRYGPKPYRYRAKPYRYRAKRYRYRPRPYAYRHGPYRYGPRYRYRGRPYRYRPGPRYRPYYKPYRVEHHHYYPRRKRFPLGAVLGGFVAGVVTGHHLSHYR